eukprot:TRINITY_DN8915_c0_g1_i5.p1 TRINITY_DN8915_c0_g1~~TRINITY_DN8915_c0_g1_i5.p1  ORF type:complete len:379 (+),score=97.11 TRINITY_DN8915_c0_g1_i5:154-1290(+)
MVFIPGNGNRIPQESVGSQASRRHSIKRLSCDHRGSSGVPACLSIWHKHLVLGQRYLQDSWQNHLAIQCPSEERTYYIRGPLAELKRWKEAIEDVTNISGGTRSHASSAAAMTSKAADDAVQAPTRSYSPDEPEVDPLADSVAQAAANKLRPNAIKVGYLEKKGEQRTAWRQRWIELREARLDYFKLPTDTTARGSIRLKGADISSTYQTKDSITTAASMLFLDVAPRDTTRVYRFRAPQATVMSWEKALKARVQALAEQGDRGVLISKGTRSVKVSRQASVEDQPRRAYVNVDPNAELMEQTLSSELQDQNLTIADRAEAVVKLEEDMQHVHGMFQDMASLVAQQGDGLSTMESNISKTQARVDAGLEDLQRANKRC